MHKFIAITMITPAFGSWPVLAGNSYIEYGQINKVQEVSFTAGALFACSKDASKPAVEQKAFQLVFHKLDQVVREYFSTVYRVVAVQNLPTEARVATVDEHRRVELQIDPLQHAGQDAVAIGKVGCQDAAAMAKEVMKFETN